MKKIYKYRIVLYSTVYCLKIVIAVDKKNESRKIIDRMNKFIKIKSFNIKQQKQALQI
jgi:hypothetical protein